MKIPNKFKARAPTSKLSWTAMVCDRARSIIQVEIPLKDCARSETAPPTMRCASQNIPTRTSADLDVRSGLQSGLKLSVDQDEG